MVNRRGASKLGCLVQLLILATIGYFGSNAARVYLRYLNYKDTVTEDVRLHPQRSQYDMRKRIEFLADSLDMPEEAGIALVKQTPRQTTVEIHWDDTIELPGFRRDVHFEIRAAGNR